MFVGIIEPDTETNGTEAPSPAGKAVSPSSNVEAATPASIAKAESEEEVTTKKEEKSSVTEESKPEAAEKPAEKPAEVEVADDESSLKQKHQLNQRELFLSKQVEILPANNIRGKCSVTLLNETESFSSYVEKEVQVSSAVKYFNGYIFIYLSECCFSIPY